MHPTFSKFNRRTHLYAGLFFLPWFLVYGLSSIAFSHPAWFTKGPQWDVISERDYRLGPIAPDADLRAIAEKIQQDSGVTGHFGVSRSPDKMIRLYFPNFIAATQVVYDPAKERLTVQKTPVRLMGVLQRLHTRGGFEGSALNKIWGVIVDVVQLMILIWIASGLYMWWNLRRLRGWGLLALGAGLASFAFFMMAL